MYSNQQPSTYTTQHYTYNSQLNSNNNHTLSFDQIHPSQSATSYSNINFEEKLNSKQQQQQQQSTMKYVNFS